MLSLTLGCLLLHRCHRETFADICLDRQRPFPPTVDPTQVSSVCSLHLQSRFGLQGQSLHPQRGLGRNPEVGDNNTNNVSTTVPRQLDSGLGEEGWKED